MKVVERKDELLLVEWSVIEVGKYYFAANKLCCDPDLFAYDQYCLIRTDDISLPAKHGSGPKLLRVSSLYLDERNVKNNEFDEWDPRSPTAFFPVSNAEVKKFKRQAKKNHEKRVAELALNIEQF